jgi:hypothetical protein
MLLKSKIFSILVLILLLISCGNSGNGSCNNSNDTITVPDFVIFITKGKHSGNFLDDPTLSGSTGIERADDFCNKDGNKPDDDTYKALLVDDSNRIAIPQTDWVLQPNTTYYRPDEPFDIKSDDMFTPIGKTTSDAIFNVAYQQLDNPIGMGESVHTGIDSLDDFSSNGYNCNNWSFNSGSVSDGLTSELGGGAFSFGGATCADLSSIYCVKQPQ